MIRVTTGQPVDPDKQIYGYPSGPNNLDGTPKTEDYNNMITSLGFGVLNQFQAEFVQSSAFQSAFTLFSKGPSPELWLPRLQSLVSSLEKSQGVLTDIVNTFVGDNQTTKLLQDAYTNLSNLVAEYNQWFNSLPVTQRSQYSDAGINVALDGGSQISGSAMGDGTTLPSDSLNAQNQAFDNAFNFVSATAGGLLDLINLVNGTFKIGSDFMLRNRGLDIQEKSLKQSADSKIQDINLQRGQFGLSPISDLSNFDNGIDNGFFELKGKNYYANEAAMFRAQYDAWKEQSTFNEFQKNKDGFGAYTEIMKDIGNINLGTRLYNELSAAEKSKFEKAKAEYELNRQNSMNERSQQIIDAELDEKYSKYTESSALSDLHKQLIDYKKSVLSDWIYEANNNQALGWLYSSVLMKSDLNLSEFMSPADAGMRYLDTGSDIIGDLIGQLNPLGWFKALKKGKPKIKK